MNSSMLPKPGQMMMGKRKLPSVKAEKSNEVKKKHKMPMP
jgi:hypothetical protein